jgi:uncharacterized membrane protein
MKTYFGSPLIEYLPSLGFLLFTIVYLSLALSYDTDARAFPGGVAWVMLVLTLLDLVSRTKTPAGVAILRVLNPGGEEMGPARGVEASTARQLLAISWVFGFAIALYLIGILPGVFAYVFIFVRFRSELSYVTAIAVSVLTTAAIWALFGLALRINFYPGVFFEF